jgi:hypothetical protein
MVMCRGAIKFQKGISLAAFQRLYGTEEQCEAALEKASWLQLSVLLQPTV